MENFPPVINMVIQYMGQGLPLLGSWLRVAGDLLSKVGVVIGKNVLYHICSLGGIINPHKFVTSAGQCNPTKRPQLIWCIWFTPTFLWMHHGLEPSDPMKPIWMKPPHRNEVLGWKFLALTYLVFAGIRPILFCLELERILQGVFYVILHLGICQFTCGFFEGIFPKQFYFTIRSHKSFILESFV